MTLERARVIKAGPTTATSTTVSSPRATRIAHEIVDARAEAARILAEARSRAEDHVAATAEAAANEAREREVARLAAGFITLRDADAQRAERDADRLIELAVLLAERLLGDMLRVQPERIAELAAGVLQETRGARQVRIDASPEDAAPLAEALGVVGRTADVRSDPSLARGSLVVYTDLGRIDAKLEPQLTRLAAALREALR